MGEKIEIEIVEKEDKKGVDWNLPLSFTKSRHTEIIEGVNAISQTWRMKERVNMLHFLLFITNDISLT